MNSVLINIDQLIKINVNSFKTYYPQLVQILWEKSNLPMAKYNMLFYSVKELKENSLYSACLAVLPYFSFIPSCCQSLTAPAACSPGAGHGRGKWKDLPSRGPPCPAQFLSPPQWGHRAACKNVWRRDRQKKTIPGLEPESLWSESFSGCTRPSLKISLHTFLSWEYN